MWVVVICTTYLLADLDVMLMELCRVVILPYFVAHYRCCINRK